MGKLRMLHNLSVLVTRPAETSEALASALRLVNALPVVTPMIEIMEIGHKSIGVIKNNFDCVVFVSKNAVRFGLPVVRESSISLKGKTIFAIGPRTAQALVDAGIKHPITPDKIYNSEGLLDSSAFKEVISDKKRVLVFRATKGRELLASTLRETGCKVDYCECYIRRISEKPIGPQLTRAGISTPDVILVTSGAILSAILRKIKEERLLGLYDAQTLVLGERLAGKVQEGGFTKPSLVVDQLTNSAIIACLATWMKPRN